MASSLQRLSVLYPGRKAGQAFSLPELLLALAIFGVLSLVSMLSLRTVTKVWQRSSARDLALRELLKAQAALERDLINGSRGPGQSDYRPVASGSGSVFSGDAIALILPDPEQQQLALSAEGSPLADRLITYYLTVPSSYTGAFGGDADGYDDRCAEKWLIRCEEAAPSPATPGMLPALPGGWLTGTVIQQPTSFWKTPPRRVVATQLLQFRVIQGPPFWDILLSAVALGDARRQLAVGSVPLTDSRFTLMQRVAVQARN